MKTSNRPLDLAPASIRDLLLVIVLSISCATHAQQRSSLGILNIEGRGVIPDPTMLGGMVRIEMGKIGRYEVLDWQDEKEVLAQNNVDPGNCYGRTCALQAGKVLKADKMLIGSVERFSERIAITLKIVDVGTGEVDLSNTSEYQNLQTELQRMIEVSVKRLLGIEPDKMLTDNLVAFNEPIDSPVAKANLSGPRFGCFYTGGLAGERMRADRVPYGGMGMAPVVSMIGWQQEIEYVNSGSFQCLFEFLFTGSGLESGRFIPAFTFLNGFRMNKSGWEFALGPTFRVVRKAEGYYVVDENGKFDAVEDWHLSKEWDPANGTNPYPTVSNLDDRGSLAISTGLVLAVGKTFKSGQLNIPVNVYAIPRKDGTTYGLSVGFNVFHSAKHK